MDKKTQVAREKLEKEGLSVERIILGDTPCYRIDGGNTLTVKEMHELADEVYAYEELIDLLGRRRAEEEGKS